MRVGIVVLVLAAMTPDARAEHAWAPDRNNLLAGPLVAFRIFEPRGDRLRIGVEGGVGAGLIRVNAGFDHRQFLYFEIDPWYIVGGTLGVGVDADRRIRPVLGIWEGIPLYQGRCGDLGWNPAITAAAGYRYTGAHELYFTVKAGAIEGVPCGQ